MADLRSKSRAVLMRLASYTLRGRRIDSFAHEPIPAFDIPVARLFAANVRFYPALTAPTDRSQRPAAAPNARLSAVPRGLSFGIIVAFETHYTQAYSPRKSTMPGLAGGDAFALINSPRPALGRTRNN